MTTEQQAGRLTAIIGQKLGMTQVFDDDARARPVTVIKAGPVRVVQVKTPETDGYSALQIAFGEAKPNRVNKPVQGHYAKAGVPPAKAMVEVRMPDVSGFEPGQEITVAEVFEAGQKADVTGTSKGKGFAGVMKRHNFSGQGASHGNHKKHRAPGSIGACATPARVFKGMRMAGRMGNDQVTTLNLEVVGVDAERGLLLLGGAVPGPKGSYVVVREAVKARG
ncbi:MAG TPA: 50S ribosomal protein L3 [Acidimicrobiia bacterium]|jgi:large subunit ribosomal protein L3|nr:50S ribosomal protein L3 [Acidimicrobiia bacterium]